MSQPEDIEAVPDKPSGAGRAIHVIGAIVIVVVLPVVLMDLLVGAFGANAMFIGLVYGVVGGKLGGTRRMLYLAPLVGVSAGLGAFTAYGWWWVVVLAILGVVAGGGALGAAAAVPVAIAAPPQWVITVIASGSFVLALMEYKKSYWIYYSFYTFAFVLALSSPGNVGTEAAHRGSEILVGIGLLVIGLAIVHALGGWLAKRYPEPVLA